MPAVFTCPAVEDFEKVLYAAVPVPEGELLLEHAAECDRCAETVERLMATDTLIDAIPLQSPASVVVSPVMVGVIERMCALPRSIPETVTSLPPDRTAGEGTEQVYDFLAPPQAADEIGRLGPYRVLQVLGIGGMGVVFQAEDPQIQRRVALKVMKPGLAASATARQRFLQEARAAGALVHDHIVAVYQVGEDGGIPFLAMPLLEGESLGDRLEREDRLPVAEVLRIGREVAEGLAAAHAHGLIHRDVTPGNIWLEGARGRVKLLDFGLARAVAVEAGLTRPGTIVGTPAYMAPEQARSGAVDARADLFGLGCVLYRAATGRVPFQGADALAILAALAVDKPPPPHALEPKLPPALSDLVLRLLAKDPAGRPASAREVATLLQSLEKDVSEPHVESPRDTPPWHRQRVALTALAATAVLGAGAVLGGQILLRIKDKNGKVQQEIKLPPGHTVEVIKMPSAPLSDAWFRWVATLPADRQVRAVADKLEECNPGFDGKVTPLIEDGVVVQLELSADDVTDLSPVRALAGLRSLGCRGSGPSNGRLADLSPLKGLPLTMLECNCTRVADLAPLQGMPLRQLCCSDTQVADLSPLRGMRLTSLNCDRTLVTNLTPLLGVPLTSLNCGWNKIASLAPLKGMRLERLVCASTQVSDLAPLQGMRLATLACYDTKVTDLLPLKGMPLKELEYDFKPERDAEILRSIKTLEKINGKSAAEFWKEAGKTVPPGP